MTEPRRFDVREPGDASELLAPLVDHLRCGGLIAMPTETVYGFGCMVEPEPLATLQRWKVRGPEKPFLLLIPDSRAVPGLLWSPGALELAATFWPGALTLILGDPDGVFPAGVRSPRGGVAVRVSPHPVARNLVEALGSPLVSTSVNRPGAAPAVSADEAMETAVALGADHRTWILDGGFLEPSEPSTIIDCTGPVPVVARSGAIPLNRLRCVLPEIHESNPN